MHSNWHNCLLCKLYIVETLLLRIAWQCLWSAACTYGEVFTIRSWIYYETWWPAFWIGYDSIIPRFMWYKICTLNERILTIKQSVVDNMGYKNIDYGKWNNFESVVNTEIVEIFDILPREAIELEIQHHCRRWPAWWCKGIEHHANEPVSRQIPISTPEGLKRSIFVTSIDIKCTHIIV